MLLDKKNALYVKCCIIPNGVEDTQGDTLYAEDIKKIFTTFNNQDNFEIYHNDLPIPEVSLLENYINTADEMIGTQTVPKGSWMAVVRVDNPEIQTGLLTSEFGGVSLNNRIRETCKHKLKGLIQYKDIPDAECVLPLFISFVKKGANRYGLHVMDYPAYIQKSDTRQSKGGRKMAFNLLEGLKSLVREAEASEKEEPVILKEDNKTIDEEPTETVDETKPAEIKKEDKPVEEDEDEKNNATIEKDDAIASLEERIISLEEKIAELESKLDNTKEDETEETTKEEDTPKIVKSASKLIKTVETEPKTNTNYFEMTNRDPITGRPIKQ